MPLQAFVPVGVFVSLQAMCALGVRTVLHLGLLQMPSHKGLVNSILGQYIGKISGISHFNFEVASLCGMAFGDVRVTGSLHLYICLDPLQKQHLDHGVIFEQCCFWFRVRF